MDGLHKTVSEALFLGRQDVEVSGRGGSWTKQASRSAMPWGQRQKRNEGSKVPAVSQTGQNETVRDTSLVVILLSRLTLLRNCPTIIVE